MSRLFVCLSICLAMLRIGGRAGALLQKDHSARTFRFLDDDYKDQLVKPALIFEQLNIKLGTTFCVTPAPLNSAPPPSVRPHARMNSASALACR